jgi:hypothetical protein
MNEIDIDNTAADLDVPDPADSSSRHAIRQAPKAFVHKVLILIPST